MSLAATLLTGAHLARLGQPLPRLVVALALLTVLGLWLVRWAYERRVYQEGRRLAAWTIGAMDRPQAQRVVRALGLLQPPPSEPLTAQLAQLHLDRLLARFSPERVSEYAQRRIRLWDRIALSLALLALGALIVGPLQVIEGLDVLLAHKGLAPVPIHWVEEEVCQVQPPQYLRDADSMFIGYGHIAQPRGSRIAFHARPLRPGRALVLTDGRTEEPFVENGQGGMVAHWTLETDTELFVAARFGQVLITQGQTLQVDSIEDKAPAVRVEGAPSTVRLVDINELPVRYEAVDDHGLTEVDLVLRSGEREERRVLVRLDGQESFNQGSSVVRSSDPLLRQAYLPVEISVQARDNDPITGPKWGQSPVITVLPPAVGEAEAMRFQALQKIRDAAIDLLAKRVEANLSEKPLAEHQAQEAQDQQAFTELVRTTSEGSFSGLSIPRRLQTLYSGQLDRLGKLIKEECPKGALQARCEQGHQKTRKATEQTLLALDAGMRALANADAVTVAKRLADVADAAAAGAKLTQGAEAKAGQAKLEASLQVLRDGGTALLKLEGLGEDLGEVVHIGVRRIERSLQAHQMRTAETAARDLAARLRSPHPSFGGGGGRHGTESGVSSGLDEAQSSSEQQLDSQHNELEEVAREHADEMGRLQEDLSQALQHVSREQLRDQAKEHAQRVRDAVRNLPSSGADSSSADGAAAATRDSAERMAEAMEGLHLDDAERRGQEALRAAEQARRLAEQEQSYFGDPNAIGGQAQGARGNLEKEVRWVQEQLQQLERAAAEQARQSIDRASKAEDKLAERTDKVGQQGRDGAAPMPKDLLETLDQAQKAMRQAAQALKAGDTQKGTVQQREAQRLLEMAREAQGQKTDAQPNEQGSEEANQGVNGGEKVDIPKADAFQGPQAFRKRVLEGLSKPGDPRLKDAVRRYAEGLLR